MRKILFILILLTALSCKKDSDPAPSNDLTRDLVGTYLYQYSEVYFGNITVETTVQWTITKIADNMISLKHRETAQVIPIGAGEPTTSKPFEITFDSIELTRADGFSFDRSVDWLLETQKMEKVRVVFDATLIGRELDVKSKTTILSEGELNEDQVRFTKQ
jgi:hypothetical protein